MESRMRTWRSVYMLNLANRHRNCDTPLKTRVRDQTHGSDILLTLIYIRQMNASLKYAIDYINPDEDGKQDLALEHTDTGKYVTVCLYAHVRYEIL